MNDEYIAGDLVKVNGKKYIITSVTKYGTHFRCNGINYSDRSSTEKEDYFLVPSGTRIIRHVRYEHFYIFLNQMATRGADFKLWRWLSPKPPRIPIEWTKSRYPGDPGYTSYIMCDEEYRAMLAGTSLRGIKKTRFREMAGLTSNASS